jgi:plastocyanin
MRYPQVLIVALLAIGCGGGGGDSTGPTGNGGNGGGNQLSANVNMVGRTAFDPAQVNLKVGGKVTYINNTGITHNVTYTSTNPTPPDNIPNFNSGSQTSTFPTAGTFSYECSIHPAMKGTVTVAQ